MRERRLYTRITKVSERSASQVLSPTLISEQQNLQVIPVRDTILKSDIDNAIVDTKRQDPEAQLPPNIQCLFLQGQLIQKTLVLQAEKDSLVVEEDELEALLDNKIRYFIGAYGSQDMLEQSRKRLSSLGRSARLDIGDATDLHHISDSSVDSIVCCRLFHLLDDAARVKILREFARIMRGELVLQAYLDAPPKRKSEK